MTLQLLSVRTEDTIIQYKHIKTIQHNIGNGITEPKLAYLDDNTMVVVKTYNGPEGNLVLFNEYLCYRLALLVDIPMPESGICLLDERTTIYNSSAFKTNFGFAFFSTYINKAATLVEEVVPLIGNKEVFYKILLFDHIVFNNDRNLGNLLVRYCRNDITLQAIDHSHVFVNQAIWDAACLKTAIEEKDYFSTRILEDNHYLYDMFFHNVAISKENLLELKDIFTSKITENSIRKIIVDIPKEWIPKGQDTDMLIKYILYRVDHFDDICATILHFIKGERSCYA